MHFNRHVVSKTLCLQKEFVIKYITVKRKFLNIFRKRNFPKEKHFVYSCLQNVSEKKKTLLLWHFSKNFFNFCKRNIIIFQQLTFLVMTSQFNVVAFRNNMLINQLIFVNMSIIISTVQMFKLSIVDILVMTSQFNYSHLIISKSCVYKSFKSTNQRFVNMSIMISTVQKCSTVFDVNSVYQSFRYYHFENTCSQIS